MYETKIDALVSFLQKKRSSGLGMKDDFDEPASWGALLLRRLGLDDLPRIEELVHAQLQALGHRAGARGLLGGLGRPPGRRLGGGRMVQGHEKRRQRKRRCHGRPSEASNRAAGHVKASISPQLSGNFCPRCHAAFRLARIPCFFGKSRLPLLLALCGRR